MRICLSLDWSHLKSSVGGSSVWLVAATLDSARLRSDCIQSERFQKRLSVAGAGHLISHQMVDKISLAHHQS